MENLNKNQKAFCREYIKNGCNGTSAYQKVYKCKEGTAKINASRLLTNANVKKYLDELQKKQETKDIMDIEERKKFLTKIVKGEAKEKAYTMFGDEFEKEANFKNKLVAIDVLNKMDGVYTSNVNFNGNTIVEIVDDINE